MVSTQSVRRGKLACAEHVVYTELDGEAVLLNVETGVYFGLDPVGTRVWNLLSEGNTEEQILGRLLEEYEVEPEQVRADVGSFMDALSTEGLVRRTD